MAAYKKKHLTQTRNVSRIRKIFPVVIKMVVSARQMGQWGRSIPGRRKSTFGRPGGRRDKMVYLREWRLTMAGAQTWSGREKSTLLLVNLSLGQTRLFYYSQ